MTVVSFKADKKDTFIGGYITTCFKCKKQIEEGHVIADTGTGKGVVFCMRCFINHKDEIQNMFSV